MIFFRLESYNVVCKYSALFFSVLLYFSFFLFFLSIRVQPAKQNEIYFKYYGIGIYYRNENLPNYRSFQRIVLKGMLGNKRRATNQFSWSTWYGKEITVCQGIWRGTMVEHWWSPLWKDYGLCTCLPHGIAMKKKRAEHGTGKNRG